MKKIIILSIVIILALLFTFNKKTGNNKPIVQTYPWQINILADGRSKVFDVVIGETTLKEIDVILNSRPKMALFEADNKLTLEAYYKNISLGGMIGSFIFTLDISDEQLKKIKKESTKKKRTDNNGIRHDLDKPTSDKSKNLIVKNLIYIPSAQLDDTTIINRFGDPVYKIKLKTKESGWHYLYPDKGLDLIYKEEGKEVLQYVAPKEFNLLLKPLQSQ